MFSDEDLDLERLRATLMQETQMKEMVEESCNELAVTVAELEKRYEGIEDESNEWKTRFEIQQEINEQLRKQIVILQEKVMQASKTTKDIQRIVKSNTITTEFGSATPNMIKLLQKEKTGLINQRKDIDWRVDQEAKAYHKANEERKNIQEEINQINANLGDIRKSNALTTGARGRGRDIKATVGTKTHKDSNHIWYKDSPFPPSCGGGARMSTKRRLRDPWHPEHLDRSSCAPLMTEDDLMMPKKPRRWRPLRCLNRHRCLGALQICSPFALRLGFVLDAFPARVDPTAAAGSAASCAAATAGLVAGSTARHHGILQHLEKVLLLLLHLTQLGNPLGSSVRVHGVEDVDNIGSRCGVRHAEQLTAALAAGFGKLVGREVSHVVHFHLAAVDVDCLQAAELVGGCLGFAGLLRLGNQHHLVEQEDLPLLKFQLGRWRIRARVVRTGQDAESHDAFCPHLAESVGECATFKAVFARLVNHGANQQAVAHAALHRAHQGLAYLLKELAMLLAGDVLRLAMVLAVLGVPAGHVALLGDEHAGYTVDTAPVAPDDAPLLGEVGRQCRVWIVLQRDVLLRYEPELVHHPLGRENQQLGRFGQNGQAGLQLRLRLRLRRHLQGGHVASGCNCGQHNFRGAVAFDKTV
uniref:Cilia- and flagella-associated protein 157 n=1 Tax=Macrostomum lignano TaxID=282301 RepID=A0A1I8ICZ7_9PLAT